MGLLTGTQLCAFAA